jgi:multiple sugar transport system permease protein/cellobiose transport system permease protein
MGTHNTEHIQTNLVLLPGSEFMYNLAFVLRTNFPLHYWNSFYVAVITTAGNVIISAMAGYGFAKYEFRHKQALFLLVIATLMLPTQLGLVGYVIQMRYMGLFNSHWALILPLMTSAFHVFWMTTYTRSGVPNEIVESGRIDGCSEVMIFMRLAFPLMRPATITVALLSFLGSWNNYFLPMVIINDERRFTVPLSILTFNTAFRVNYAASILALTLAVIPVVIMFGLFSKHLISGLTSGSIKG